MLISCFLLLGTIQHYIFYSIDEVPPLWSWKGHDGGESTANLVRSSELSSVGDSNLESATCEDNNGYYGATFL